MRHNRIAVLALTAAALFAFAAPVPEAAAQDQFTFTANLDASQLHESVAQVATLAGYAPSPIAAASLPATSPIRNSPSE